MNTGEGKGVVVVEGASVKKVGGGRVVTGFASFSSLSIWLKTVSHSERSNEEMSLFLKSTCLA